MKQWTVENNMIKTDQMVRFRALGLCRVTGCCSAGVRTAADQCGSSYHSLDITLSHSKHRTVGGGLPAMNDDAISLTYRVGCIAGKPPPTEFAARQRYVKDVVAPPHWIAFRQRLKAFLTKHHAAGCRPGSCCADSPEPRRRTRGHPGFCPSPPRPACGSLRNAGWSPTTRRSGDAD